jgi:predicted protein tyrosine phosphatase
MSMAGDLAEMTLIVSPLRYVETLVAVRRPSHMITLLAPEEMIHTPPGFPAERHLKLGVHDIAYPMEGLTHPDPHLIERILDFGRAWDEAAPLLIHCWAGISRSTAAAFAIACERSPKADEYEIARRLRRASPSAYPNRMIVALADNILDRRGRMLEAVEAIGANNFAVEGEPFDLPARH